jgi:hypothetical protein
MTRKFVRRVKNKDPLILIILTGYGRKFGASKLYLRHQTLLWRILNEALPVRSELIKRGIHCSMICPRCYAKIETSK